MGGVGGTGAFWGPRTAEFRRARADPGGIAFQSPDTRKRFRHDEDYRLQEPAGGRASPPRLYNHVQP